MQDVSKEWLDFLRGQFPAGSRIQTWKLDDPRNTLKEAGNAVPNCPDLWEAGTLKLNSKGDPILRLSMGITESSGVQTFWPWRDEQLTRVFYSAPMARFEVEAWDVYKNGKYLYTEYNVMGM